MQTLGYHMNNGMGYQKMFQRLDFLLSLLCLREPGREKKDQDLRRTLPELGADCRLLHPYVSVETENPERK